MFGFDSINISTAGNILYAIIGTIAAAAFAVYIYNNSLPKLSPAKNVFLFSLRGIILALLLFIAIEPIIKLTTSTVIQPRHLIFIDNSLSMTRGDKEIKKTQIIQSFLPKLLGLNAANNITFYSFGGNVNPLAKDSLNKLNYSESSTNFYSVFQYIEKEKIPASSITFITDGIQTDGSNPLSIAANKTVPVLSIALGDTAVKKDIAVSELRTNEYIYPCVSTSVRAVIISTFPEPTSVKLSFVEETKLIDSKTIMLNSGNNVITLDYKPFSAGTKRLKITIDPILAESNKENNSKSIYIKVLENKRKAVVVAGYPSPDITFIRQSLQLDTNIQVYNIVEIGENKTLAPVNQTSIDSADVFIFVHYPVQNSSVQLFRSIKKQIVEKKKPLFTLIDENNSQQLFKEIEEILPVTAGRQTPGISSSQPVLNSGSSNLPFLSENGYSAASDWENLPPILRANTEYLLKPEAKKILSAKINNVVTDIPLLCSRDIGSTRSMAFIGRDIWRWKLSNDRERSAKFDQFILGAFKWLFAVNQQNYFVLKTNKQFFSQNENVEFIAELSDNNLAPISDGQIGVQIQTPKAKESLLLNSLGSGLYEGNFIAKEQGDYSFTGTVDGTKQSYKPIKGRFNAGENLVEFSDTRTDIQLPANLSNTTSGKIFLQDSLQAYLTYLEALDKTKVSTKQEYKEFIVWNNSWTLIIVIFLFSLEWFLRKRAGML